MDIKSTSEIIHQMKYEIFSIESGPFQSDSVMTIEDVQEAMKEYAAQFLDLAAEEATCYQSEFDGSYVNEKSILILKEQIK
jgi:hypothetical protein